MSASLNGNGIKEWVTYSGKKFNKYVANLAHIEYERIRQKNDPTLHLSVIAMVIL